MGELMSSATLTIKEKLEIRVLEKLMRTFTRSKKKTNFQGSLELRHDKRLEEQEMEYYISLNSDSETQKEDIERSSSQLDLLPETSTATRKLEQKYSIRALALLDFAAVSPAQISFTKGDILDIQSEGPRANDSSEWLVASHHSNTGTIGQVPSSYMALSMHTSEDVLQFPSCGGDGATLQSAAAEATGAIGAEDIEREETAVMSGELINAPEFEFDKEQDFRIGWVPEANKIVAHELLSQKGLHKGTFLTRPSSSQWKGLKTLSVRPFREKRGKVIQHYRIQEDDNVFFIQPTRKFQRLSDLIIYYQFCIKSCLACQLSYPYTECITELKSGTATTIPLKYIEIPEKHLKFGRQIGQGNFGVVVLATWTEGDRHDKVAVKVIHDNPEVMKKTQHAFAKEAENMHQLRHPRLVEIYGICSKKFAIVTEYMEQGSLDIWLQKNKKNEIPQEQLLEIIRQVVDGMEFMESKRVVHCDLRAANVLVDKDVNTKICDFGLSRMMGNDANRIIRAAEFAWRWAALEVLEESVLTTKSDVWSFGLVMWEIFTFGKVPYTDGRIKADNYNELLVKLKDGERLEQPGGCSDASFEIMTSCWAAEATRRPRFSLLKEKLKDLAEP